MDTLESKTTVSKWSRFFEAFKAQNIDDDDVIETLATKQASSFFKKFKNIAEQTMAMKDGER